MSMVTHFSAVLMCTFFLVFCGEDTSDEETDTSSGNEERGAQDEVEVFMIFYFKLLSTAFS